MRNGRNKMAQGIYCHKLGNDILYVGQSVNINKRKQEHLRHLKEGNHDNQYLQHVFDRHPEIEMGVLVEEVENRADLTKREIYWIKQLKPRCNITLPSEEDKWIISQETKEKISDTFKRKNIRYKRSPKDREQIKSRRLKYYQENEFPEVVKKKISVSVKKLWENEEYRERMSDAHRGKSTSPKQKESARLTNHIRWHLKRGIINTNCKYCKENINAR